MEHFCRISHFGTLQKLHPGRLVTHGQLLAQGNVSTARMPHKAQEHKLCSCCPAAHGLLVAHGQSCRDGQDRAHLCCIQLFRAYCSNDGRALT